MADMTFAGSVNPLKAYWDKLLNPKHKLRVVGIGDSNMFGFGARVPYNRGGWLNQVLDNDRSIVGEGGFWHNIEWVAANVGSEYTWGASGSNWSSQTGGLGGQNFFLDQSKTGAATTITTPLCRYADIYHFQQGSGGGGTFTVSVDGGAGVAVDCGAGTLSSRRNVVTRFDMGFVGHHTLSITGVTTAGQQIFIEGIVYYASLADRGLLAINAGHNGARAGLTWSYNGSSADNIRALVGRAATSADPVPDCIFLNLGLNDMAYSVAVEDAVAAITNIVTALDTLKTPICWPITPVLISDDAGTYGAYTVPAGATQAAYHAALATAALAASSYVCVVNTANSLGGTVAAAKASGYTTSPNDIHMSATGHDAFAADFMTKTAWPTITSKIAIDTANAADLNWFLSRYGACGR